jgi:hypothetical protein
MAGVIGPIGPARSIPSAPTRLGKSLPERGFGEVLGEVAGVRAPAAGPAQLPTAAGPARAVPPSHGSPAEVRRALVNLVEGERKMDHVIRAALSGRDFSTQELIAIQATVLRHTQEVEAVSRLLDRLTGAVKTTLQTQV